MLLVGAQNGLEVSNEECSQSRWPDPSVSHYARFQWAAFVPQRAVYVTSGLRALCRDSYIYTPLAQPSLTVSLIHPRPQRASQ